MSSSSQHHHQLPPPLDVDVDVDAGAVAAVVAAAVAAAAASAVASSVGGHPTAVGASHHVPPPPPPLPQGWLLKESRAHPGYHYYFHMDTGAVTWDPPVNTNTNANTTSGAEQHQPLMMMMPPSGDVDMASNDYDGVGIPSATSSSFLSAVQPMQVDGDDDDGGGGAFVQQQPSGRKHGRADEVGRDSNSSSSNNAVAVSSSGGGTGGDKSHPPSQSQPHTKKRRTTGETADETDDANADAPGDDADASTPPQQVRVLHILKKHKDSRRPTSWRGSEPITRTVADAHDDLQGLLEILGEIDPVADATELRATFEELARTESDCSSAKRGGDLGYFGRRKMQPAFEAASFALAKGEMTHTVVDTSSGSHIILRIG